VNHLDNRTKWILDNLGMVTLVGSQIWWTWETEDVFRRVREGNKHAMKDFAAMLTGQLAELTTMVRQLSPLVVRQLSPLVVRQVEPSRCTLVAMIGVACHCTLPSLYCHLPSLYCPLPLR